MNVRNVLIIIGIIAVVLLIAQYIAQVRRIKAGDNYVSGGRAFLNWLLLFVIIGSFGGSVYANHRAKSEQQAVPTNVASSSSEENDQLYVNFDKAKARLNDNGVAPMKMIVSPGTKVKIVGHRTGKVYKVFRTAKGDDPVTIKYKFEFAAKYDIVATKNGKKIVKHLTVKDQESESSSSSSSSVSSSSSSTSHSSSSESHSSSNGGSSSGNGGSSSSNGGSTSTPSRSYGGGGGYTSRGNGGSSRPTISDQPMINNQPIQNQ